MNHLEAGLTVDKATHNLLCVHSYNLRSQVEYHMRCIILKEMPNNRAKILVFGDRRLKVEFTRGKKRIRYVGRERLSLLEHSDDGDK